MESTSSNTNSHESTENDRVLPEVVSEKLDPTKISEMIKAAPTVKSKMEDPQYFKVQVTCVHMVLKLERELQSSKYHGKDVVYKRNHLMQEYQVLAFQNAGLWEAAIDGTLRTGETGKILKAFMDGEGDQAKTIAAMKKYGDDSAQQVISRIELANKKSEEDLEKKRIIREHMAKNSSQ